MGKINAHIEQVPRMVTIYLRKYCRQYRESFYLEAPQAAAFSG
jgi:hypothetical protein